MTNEQRRLADRIAEHRGVRGLARAISENPGYLSAVANGKRPASNRLRVKLGLPPRMAPAPCCPTCGVPHIRKTCPNAKRESAPRKRRVRYSETAVASLVSAYTAAVIGVMLGAAHD